MINYFVFDGVSSRSFNVLISGVKTYTSPQRDYEEVAVAGRNGSVMIDNGRFSNIDISYRCFMYEHLYGDYEAFKAFLLSKKGYKRLEDVYHPEHYRLAMVSAPLDPDIGKGYRTGGFDLKFRAMPQMFLLSGENTITLTETGKIENPTLFDAKPFMRVYGAGELGINSETITIKKADEYTDIDCYLEDAYKDNAATNCNQNIELTGDSFPVLVSGENNISLGEGITKVEIIPHWWTL